jgi:hypothetical protein
MEQPDNMTIPIEVPVELWGEIGKWSYESYCLLRNVNKQLHEIVSTNDIRGLFDYVYVSANGEFNSKMLEFFKRVFVINTKLNEVIYYKNSDQCRIVCYEPGDEIYNITSISRCRKIGSYVLYEYVGFKNGKISRCNRNLTIDIIDTVDETYLPMEGICMRRDPQGTETLNLPIGYYCPFWISDRFFLYNAKSLEV